MFYPMDVHTEQINEIALNNNESMVVTCSVDKKLRLFSVNNSKLQFLSELLGHDCEIMSAIFVRDDIIASSDCNGNLIIWNMTGHTFQQALKINVCTGSVNSVVSLSKDKIKLACGCYDGKIRIYEINGQNYDMKELFGSEFGVTSLSANYDFFVSGGFNFKMNLFKDDKLIHTFADHKKKINDVAISPSYEFKVFCFASGSDDKTVIIYQQDDGEKGEINTQTKFKKQIIELPEPVYGLKFSKVGFCLTVSYGQNKYKSFMPNTDGIFQEAELEEIVE